MPSAPHSPPARQANVAKAKPTANTPTHRFAAHPHRTLLGLSVPVFFSLVAEPITGLVDTAFVSRLGEPALAALGAATTLLSSGLWVFNFLAIGVQTELATAMGASSDAVAASFTTGNPPHPRATQRTVVRAGVALGALAGCAVALLAWPWLAELAALMGASKAGPAVQEGMVVYMGARLWGLPWALVTTVCMGAMRGAGNMRTPMWIAFGVNGLNLVLDPVLIFGWPALGVPAFGLAGAAWATVVAQTMGGWVALWVVRETRADANASRKRRQTLVQEVATPNSDTATNSNPSTSAASNLALTTIKRLLTVGRDMFIRTGLLLLFLLVATRKATLMGAEAGAAHQVIRQAWFLTALGLDAFASSAQTLVGWYVGAGDKTLARRAAAVACGWSVALGTAWGLGMLVTTDLVAAVFALSPVAKTLFVTGWTIAALSQPINALPFATDGIHWGTGDYGYLRSAMIIASGVGIGLLTMIPTSIPSAGFTAIWLVTALWITLRGGLGMLRIWPGIGRAAPLHQR